jgi:effector-binding domain-containing protein
MDIEIIDQIFRLDIYGFSGVAENNDHIQTAFQLMDKMWQVVEAHGLGNEGKNIWVYEADKKVFAGVELHNSPANDIRLEHKNIRLEKYAYYKHIGPYNQLKQAGQNMRNELTKKGFEISFPYIEIYGHWTSDETKLETELFMCLK